MSMAYFSRHEFLLTTYHLPFDTTRYLKCGLAPCLLHTFHNLIELWIEVLQDDGVVENNKGDLGENLTANGSLTVAKEEV